MLKQTNLNSLAKELTKLEGKKIQTDIAQIKEILRALFKHYSLREIVEIYLKFNPE